MINVILSGYGKMGQVIEETIEHSNDMKCVGVVDPMREDMCKSLKDMCQRLVEKGQTVHAVIDFSHPGNLDNVVEGIKAFPTPLIVATTGFTDEQIESIDELAKEVPIVFSSNFSIGINLMKRIAKEMSDTLGEDFDIEIVEKHHNRKVDSPSGTAITLVDSIDPDKVYKRQYGRVGMGKREKEIGMHSLRGGSIAGEHTVIFAGESEVLEITHIAESKDVFAKGAVRAARFIVGKEPGLYSMDQVLSK